MHHCYFTCIKWVISDFTISNLKGTGNLPKNNRMSFLYYGHTNVQMYDDKME